MIPARTAAGMRPPCKPRASGDDPSYPWGLAAQYG